MAKASKRPKKPAAHVDERVAQAIAQRKQLKMQLKVERENIRLANQLEQLSRRNSLRLAELGARFLSRAKHILADDAKLDDAVATARAPRRDRTVQPSAVDDSYVHKTGLAVEVGASER